MILRKTKKEEHTIMNDDFEKQVAKKVSQIRVDQEAKRRASMDKLDKTNKSIKEELNRIANKKGKKYSFKTGKDPYKKIGSRFSL